MGDFNNWGQRSRLGRDLRHHDRYRVAVREMINLTSERSFVPARLIDNEHSMKNELIVASYKDLPRERAARKLSLMLEELGIDEMQQRFWCQRELSLWHCVDSE